MAYLAVKPGDRVIHKNHGAGEVTARGLVDSEAFVRFDVQPEGWDQELCVSTNLLRKERVRPFKYADGKPIIPKYIVEIASRIECTGCYTYKLKGQNANRPAYGIDADYDRLCKWAEDHGAAMKIIATSRQRKNYYVVFEMTDPVAQALEKAGLIK